MNCFIPLGRPYQDDRDYMEVIGPNGPELRRCTPVRSDRPGQLIELEPDHDPETERVQRDIQGRVYIMKVR